MVHRDLADGYDLHGEALADRLEQPHEPVGACRVPGQEHEPRPVPSGLRDGDAERGDEPVGDLHEDACSVAGLAVAVLGTPVGHLLQQPEAYLHRAVGPLAVETDGQADAAAVAVVRRIVETCIHRIVLRHAPIVFR